MSPSITASCVSYHSVIMQRKEILALDVIRTAISESWVLRSTNWKQCTCMCEQMHRYGIRAWWTAINDQEIKHVSCFSLLSRLQIYNESNSYLEVKLTNGPSWFCYFEWENRIMSEVLSIIFFTRTTIFLVFFFFNTLFFWWLGTIKSLT